MLEIASRSQLRWAFLRAAAIFVPLLLVLAGMSARIGANARSGGWYDGLIKPALNPPSAAFPIAWTLLYILMGLAVAMVWHAKGNSLRKLALGLFCGQAILNFLWTPAFFGMRQPMYGLIIIILLVVMLIATTYIFYRVRKVAGMLMLPTLVWVLFATYLNFEIWRKNPNAASMAVQQPVAPMSDPGQPQQSPGVIPL
jgi:translocator protein